MTYDTVFINMILVMFLKKFLVVIFGSLQVGIRALV